MKRRRQKQFFFGILFLAVGALVVRGAVNLVGNVPAVTEQKNIPIPSQEELLVQYPILVLGEPSLDRGVILGSIENRTEDRESKAYFTVLILDVHDQILEEKEGKVIIPPQESLYVFATDLETPFSAMNRASITIHGVDWVSEELLRSKNFGFSDEVETEIIGSDRIIVHGTVKNQSVAEARRVEILAVLFDDKGNELFAGQTRVTNLESFGQRNFSINIPFDQSIANRVNLRETKLFVTDFQ